MSGIGRRRVGGARAAAGLGLAAVGAFVPVLPAIALTFGAVGDSLTDEYRFERGQVGLNFVEQLVLFRGLDFGPWVADPSIRGEPRNEGYAHNWARFGASANEPTYEDVNLFNELPRLNPMPRFETQVDGLAAEIAAGDVDVAYVGIGANDFFIHLFLDRDFQGPEFEAFSDALVATVFDAVDAFLAAGATLVVVGAIPDELVPNPGAHPPISPFIDPADYAAAVAVTNQALAQEAAARGIPFVDPWAEVDARTDAEGNLTVGGRSFSNQSVARASQLLIRPEPDEPHGPCNLDGTLCASEAYALNYYLSDMVHPNTIIQSLMANEILRVLDAELGLGVAPFSDEEILSIALEPVPEPGALGFATLAALLFFRARRLPPRGRRQGA